MKPCTDFRKCRSASLLTGSAVIWRACSSWCNATWAVSKLSYLIRHYYKLFNLFLDIISLVAFTILVDNLFHLIISLCEKKYFLTSNVHCSFTTCTTCPLVLLSFPGLINILCSNEVIPRCSEEDWRAV